MCMRTRADVCRARAICWRGLSCAVEWRCTVHRTLAEAGCARGERPLQRGLRVEPTETRRSCSGVLRSGIIEHHVVAPSVVAHDCCQVIRNRTFQLVGINKQINQTRAEARKLTQHDVFGHTCEVVVLGKRRSVHEHFHSLFKRCTKHGTSVRPIHAMSRHSHKVSAKGHAVCQKPNMTVIHIRIATH
jgi:hypothetical protein